MFFVLLMFFMLLVFLILLLFLLAVARSLHEEKNQRGQ
jgi:hypothetical protein